MITNGKCAVRALYRYVKILNLFLNRRKTVQMQCCFTAVFLFFRHICPYINSYGNAHINRDSKSANKEPFIVKYKEEKEKRPCVR